MEKKQKPENQRQKPPSVGLVQNKKILINWTFAGSLLISLSQILVLHFGRREKSSYLIQLLISEQKLFLGFTKKVCNSLSSVSTN